MTWERLKELMDNQYYPLDVQRMKEKEFLSLKQGNLSVMEYASRFNELPCEHRREKNGSL